MKSMQWAVLAALLAVGPVFGFAAPPPGRDKGKDVKKAVLALQGTWKVSKLETDHEETRTFFEKAGKVVVKGDKVTLLAEVGKGKTITLARFTAKVKPGKSPKEVDLRIDDVVANPAGKSRIGKTLQGLYTLKGDTLKLFVPGEGESLPKVFLAEGSQGVLTLKKVKAKE